MRIFCLGCGGHMESACAICEHGAHHTRRCSVLKLLAASFFLRFHLVHQLKCRGAVHGHCVRCAGCGSAQRGLMPTLAPTAAWEATLVLQAWTKTCTQKPGHTGTTLQTNLSELSNRKNKQKGRKIRRTAVNSENSTLPLDRMFCIN